MIVVPGEPYDWNWCYQVDSNNLTYCVILCDEDTSCIVAYVNSSTEICYQCQIGQIDSIKYSTEQAIGFKASISECTMSHLNEYSTSDYTVNYDSSTGLWSFTYVSSKSCEDGWALSNRATVQWCVRIFIDVINGYNGSVSYCEAENAVVSAIGSAFEASYLKNKPYDYFPENELRAIITDGYMKDECLSAFYYLNYTSTCNFPDGFVWTDTYNTNFTFYNWLGSNPDCGNWNQFCLAQYTIKDDTTHDGLIDTQPCGTASEAVYDSTITDFAYSANNLFNGVMCGKLAT